MEGSLVDVLMIVYWSYFKVDLLNLMKDPKIFKTIRAQIINL